MVRRVENKTQLLAALEDAPLDKECFIILGSLLYTLYSNRSFKDHRKVIRKVKQLPKEVFDVA